MRPSRSRRLYLILSSLVVLTAVILASRAWYAGELTWDTFERGRDAYGTLSAILNIVFPYLSQAAAIVGFVMTTARIWQFAERRLPERLNDLVAKWQIASDDERRTQLRRFDETWAAIPQGVVEPVHRLRSELSFEPRSSLGDLAWEGANLAQMRRALSQKSFERVTHHYVRALNYLRLAEVMDDPKTLRENAVREFNAALEHHRDVEPERRDLDVYKAHAAALAEAKDSAARLVVLQEWLIAARERGIERDAYEAQIEISAVQLVMSNVEGVKASRSNALRAEAQYQLEEAVDHLNSQAMSRDAVRARANDVLGDVKYARQLATAINAWQAALSDYRNVGDADSAAALIKKIRLAGHQPNGFAPGPSPAALLITALVEVCDCKRQMGNMTDAWATIESARSRVNIYLSGGLIGAAEAVDLRLAVAAAMNKLDARPPTPTRQPSSAQNRTPTPTSPNP